MYAHDEWFTGDLMRVFIALLFTVVAFAPEYSRAEESETPAASPAPVAEKKKAKPAATKKIPKDKSWKKVKKPDPSVEVPPAPLPRK